MSHLSSYDDLDSFIWSLCRICWRRDKAERPKTDALKEGFISHNATEEGIKWYPGNLCECFVCSQKEPGSVNKGMEYDDKVCIVGLQKDDATI